MEAQDIEIGRPIDAWARLPLAEATITAWRFIFDEERLYSLWAQYRGRHYQKVISFPMMLHLVAEALLHYEGSGRRSFEKNIEAGQLDASVQAAFAKLGRLPLALSEALLREGTAAVGALFPHASGRPLPESLQAF